MELPDATADLIDGLKSEAAVELVTKVEKVLADSVAAAVAERRSLLSEVQSIEADHADLIAKHEANEELRGFDGGRRSDLTATRQSRT